MIKIRETGLKRHCRCQTQQVKCNSLSNSPFWIAIKHRRFHRIINVTPSLSTKRNSCKRFRHNLWKNLSCIVIRFKILLQNHIELLNKKTMIKSRTKTYTRNYSKQMTPLLIKFPNQQKRKNLKQCIFSWIRSWQQLKIKRWPKKERVLQKIKTKAAY